MTVGEKIRERRLALGMTMEDLGKSMNVGRSAINKYEKGIVDDLKSSQLIKLSKILGISILELLDDEPEEDPEERRLLDAYRGADPKIRKAALTMLEDSAAERAALKEESQSERMA